MRITTLLVCTLPLLLTGCAGALVSTGAQTGMAAAENRSFGRKVDDTVIYTDITNRFIQANQAALLGHVSLNVRFGRVMLTGNVQSEDQAQKAVEITWQAKGVTEVINELVVNPNNSLLDTAGDAIIKRNLEARLLVTKGVWVINYSLDVNGGTAFMLGRVKDQAELDRALNVARTTRGVKRVVSHLQINTDTSHPITSPDQAPGTESNGSSSNSNGFTSSRDNGSAVDVDTSPTGSTSSYGNSHFENTSTTLPANDSISSTPLPPSGSSAPKEPVGGGY